MTTVLAARTVARVLVVEDQQTLAEALERVFAQEHDLESAGTATTGQQALRILALEDADVAVIDVGLPDIDGIELCRRMRRINSRLRVVLITAEPCPALAREAIAAGARAFLSKTMSLDTLLSAVKGREDTFAVDPTLLLARQQDVAGPGLSPRECEILCLMGEGHDARTIAGRLHLSVHTTRGYIKALYRKLDVHNQLEAVAVGARLGVLRRGA